jgi:hypothetical protein
MSSSARPWRDEAVAVTTAYAAPAKVAGAGAPAEVALVLVPVLEPMLVPVLVPVLDPVLVRVLVPVLAPVLDPVLACVLEPVLDPVLDLVLDPVLTPVRVPVVDPVLVDGPVPNDPSPFPGPPAAMIDRCTCWFGYPPPQPHRTAAQRIPVHRSSLFMFRAPFWPSRGRRGATDMPRR